VAGGGRAEAGAVGAGGGWDGRAVAGAEHAEAGRGGASGQRCGGGAGGGGLGGVGGGRGGRRRQMAGRPQRFWREAPRARVRHRRFR
jgi:hypothetical protein